MNRINEKLLMIRFAAGFAGREEVMKYIWENFSKGLLYYISRFFPCDPMNCDDVFQEVMVKIYSALDSYNPLYSMSTWLYTVARNQCIDSIRSRDRESGIRSDDVNSLYADQGADEIFFREELKRAVDSAFKSLDLRGQEVVYLRFYEGRSFRQIAEITGINHSTVKQIYKRAERILHGRLKDYEGN